MPGKEQAGEQEAGELWKGGKNWVGVIFPLLWADPGGR